MKLKKILTISLGVSLLLIIASLASVGIHYSNVIMFPLKHGLSDIPKSWGVRNKTLQNYGLEYEDVSFKTKDNLTLKGWYVPSDTNGKKAILLVHGYGVNRVIVLQYVPFLNKAGYDVLLFDLRAHGESEGRYCSMGYYEKEDIHSAVRYLKETKGMEKIGILGQSMGAATSVLAMAENEDILAGVFDSPFSSLKDLLIYRGKRDHGLNRFPFMESVILITEYRLGYDMDKVSSLDVIGDISPRAVFLIHGDADDEVLPDNSKALYENISEPKELWLAQGVSHVKAFTKYPEEYKKKVLSFFNRYLGPFPQEIARITAKHQ